MTTINTQRAQAMKTPESPVFLMGQDRTNSFLPSWSIPPGLLPWKLLSIGTAAGRAEAGSKCAGSGYWAVDRNRAESGWFPDPWEASVAVVLWAGAAGTWPDGADDSVSAYKQGKEVKTAVCGSRTHPALSAWISYYLSAGKINGSPSSIVCASVFWCFCCGGLFWWVSFPFPRSRQTETRGVSEPGVVHWQEK